MQTNTIYGFVKILLRHLLQKLLLICDIKPSMGLFYKRNSLFRIAVVCAILHNIYKQLETNSKKTNTAI